MYTRAGWDIVNVQTGATGEDGLTWYYFDIKMVPLVDPTGWYEITSTFKALRLERLDELAISVCSKQPKRYNGIA